MMYGRVLLDISSEQMTSISFLIGNDIYYAFIFCMTMNYEYINKGLKHN